MQFSKAIGSALVKLIPAAWLFFAAPFAIQQSSAQSAEPADTSNAQSIPSTNRLLDGLQFKAGIVKSEDGSGNSLEDTLVFSDGNFSSVVCKRYNFSAAPYWIRTEGKRIHFLAELTSPTDGTMVWKGTVADGELRGTMRWTKKRWYWTIDAEHLIQGKVDTEAQSVSASQQ